MSQQKFGGGLIFKNRRKQQPKHPDYTGNEIKVCCPACHVESTFAVAAWEKQGKKAPFISLAITEPREEGQGQIPKSEVPAANEQSQPIHNQDGQEDDVPF